jgi:RecG-like helicase
VKVLDLIEEELRNGGSVFWVFPLVRESEHFNEMGSAEQVCAADPAQGDPTFTIP